MHRMMHRTMAQACLPQACKHALHRTTAQACKHAWDAPHHGASMHGASMHRTNGQSRMAADINLMSRMPSYCKRAWCKHPPHDAPHGAVHACTMRTACVHAPRAQACTACVHAPHVCVHGATDSTHSLMHNIQAQRLYVLLICLAYMSCSCTTSKRNVSLLSHTRARPILPIFTRSAARKMPLQFGHPNLSWDSQRALDAQTYPGTVNGR